MGLRATAAETEALRRAHPENPVVFTEDRAYPVHPASWLPMKWADGAEARNSFAGTADKDEYYVWQIALWTPGGTVDGVTLGFSDLVMSVDFDLLEVLTEWSKMPAAEPYRKLDISRYLSLISKLREKGFLLTKEQELRAANIPFDETEDALMELFFDFLRRWSRGERIEQPGLPEGASATLPELEQYYRKLDLYFSFAKAFGCDVDRDRLYDTRERVADEINEILIYRLQNNIRFCEHCGKALPLHHRGRLCDDCYRRQRGSALLPRKRSKSGR